MQRRVGAGQHKLHNICSTKCKKYFDESLFKCIKSWSDASSTKLDWT